MGLFVHWPNRLQEIPCATGRKKRDDFLCPLAKTNEMHLFGPLADLPTRNSQRHWPKTMSCTLMSTGRRTYLEFYCPLTKKTEMDVFFPLAESPIRNFAKKWVQLFWPLAESPITNSVLRQLRWPKKGGSLFLTTGQDSAYSRNNSVTSFWCVCVYIARPLFGTHLSN